MYKRFHLAIGALLASLLTLPSPLEAATYTFHPIALTNSPSQALDYEPNTFPIVSISIQDSAVASGSFSTTYTSSPATFGGNYASLIYFDIQNIVDLTPDFSGSSSFRANLLFNTDGSVSAGALFYSGDSFEVDLAGSADLFQGAFNTYGNTYQGFVTGTLIAVSEPTSLVLLGISVFSMSLIRRWTHREDRATLEQSVADQHV